MNLNTVMWIASFSMGATSQINDAATTTDPIQLCEHLARRDPQIIELGDASALDEIKVLLAHPLDATSAATISMLNNSDVRSQCQRLVQNAALVRQAGLPGNPQLDVESVPERDTQLELRLGYNLASVLIAHYERSAAAAEAEVGGVQVKQELAKLRYAAQAALYELIAARQRVSFAQSITQTLAAAREAASALHEAGNIPFTELGLQTAAYERSRVSLSRLQLKAARKRERLARILGLRGANQAWTVVDTFKPLENTSYSTSFEDAAVDASTDLLEVQLRVEAASRKRKATAVRGWTPDVTVDFHSLYGRPRGSISAANESLWSFGAGISLTLPFVDRQQGQVQAYDSEIEALKSTLNFVETEVRSVARELDAMIQAAAAQVQAYESRILPAQAQVTRQSMLQYNAMQIGVIDLLRSKQDEFSQQLAYVDAQNDLAQAQVARIAMLSGVRPSLVRTDGEAVMDLFSAPEGGSDE